MSDALQAYRHRLTAFSLAYEANIPLMIWGRPGEGKSAMVSEFAGNRGIHQEVVVASLRDPSDFNGMPVVQDGVVRLVPPAWLLNTNAQQGSLLVLDEFNLATPATRGATLRVVNERVSADTPLDSTTRIVAISNPPDLSEDGWELGAPSSNRFFHLRDWQQPAEAFLLGLVGGEWAQAPSLVVDPERLEAGLQRAKAAVAGFLSANENLLSRIPDHPEDRQYAWPSPRSWTMLTNLLATAWAAEVDDRLIDDEVISLVVSGCVGAAAQPFLSFLQTLDMPTTQELLDDPTNWEVPDRGDLTYAILAQLIHRLANGSPQAEDFRRAGLVIAHAADQQGDVAVSIGLQWWSMAKQHGPKVMPQELATGPLARVAQLAGSSKK